MTDRHPGSFNKDITQMPVAERTHFPAALLVPRIVGTGDKPDIAAEVREGFEAIYIHNFRKKGDRSHKAETGDSTEKKNCFIIPCVPAEKSRNFSYSFALQSRHSASKQI